MALTPRQKIFVDEYIKSGDSTDASIKAGYNKNAAAAIGKRNLKMPKIIFAISELIGAENLSVDGDQVAGGAEILQFLTGVMRGDVRDSKSVVDKSSGGVIQLEDLPKISERTKAAELLGKTTALFSDKDKVGGKVLPPIVIYGEQDLEDQCFFVVCVGYVSLVR